MSGAREGVGERVPVRLIEGAQRAEILKTLGLEKSAAKEPLQYATLACNRRFTSGSRMQIVFGKGVATPSGVANTVEKRFDFKVREPFAAEFSCERENAQPACLPIRPMQLSFNAPVPRSLATAIRLKSAKETLKPQTVGGIEGQKGDALVNSVQFAAPLSENTAFTLELPKDFKDASGPPAAQCRQLSAQGIHGWHAAPGQVCGSALWHRRAFCRRSAL